MNLERKILSQPHLATLVIIDRRVQLGGRLRMEQILHRAKRSLTRTNTSSPGSERPGKERYGLGRRDIARLRELFRYCILAVIGQRLEDHVLPRLWKFYQQILRDR